MGVCYYVKASVDEYTDHGCLAIATGIDSSRVKEVINALLDECRRLKMELVGREELRKTKEYLTGHMSLGLETSDAIAEYYGFQEILRLPIKTPAERKKEIEKVTSGDIQKVAKDIFQNRGLNLAVVGKISNPNSLKKILVI